MNENDDRKSSSRRDLLKLASVASMTMGVSQASPQKPASPNAKSVSGMPFEKKDVVRLGVIGVGGRGNSLINNYEIY